MDNKMMLPVLATTLLLLAMFIAPAMAAEQRKPDLMITDIFVGIPVEAKDDVMKTYIVNYEITNIGDAPAYGAGISCLYVNGVHVAKEDLNEITLNPGDSYWSVFRNYELPCNCTVNITVCADNYDQIREINETNNCLTKTWRCPWNFKPPFPNYAPSGMPDFDQKQDDWRNLNKQWSFCGPVSAANCLWWFDSMYAYPKGKPGDGEDIFPLVNDYGAPYPWIPGPYSDDHNFDNVDDTGTPWPPGNEFVERLARCMDTDGMSSGAPRNGTNIYDMQRCIDGWLKETGLDCTLYEHTVRSPDFYWIEKELKRCQNIIILLGFWYYDEENGTWKRIGGHYVTVAGVNAEERLIALSDPFMDNAVVTGRGRVLPSWHPQIYLPTLHNDALYVSHDYYSVKPKSPSPGGDWWIPDYPISYELLENFRGMNVPEGGVVPPPQETPSPDRVHTEIEYAVVVSPCKTVISIDDEGNEADEFVPGTNVSVKGCGFKPNFTYVIYIQPEPVVEGQRLNPNKDPSGVQETVRTDANGCFGQDVIWKIPAQEPACSYWDIVVDYVPAPTVPTYNARYDGLDNVCCHGFHIAGLPGIEVNKTVWNGTAWVKEINANISDMVRFRCEIHNNGTCCPLSDIKVTDILPLNLQYKNNATVHYPNCTTVPQEPLIGIPNIFTWMFPDFVLRPSETLTVEFDAKVMKCEEGENVLQAKAWCEETGEIVFDEDSMMVKVLCPDLVMEEKWEEPAPMRKYLHIYPPVDPREPIKEPVCTDWHELYPEFCNWYHLSNWSDNGDDVLSPCDRIKMTEEAGSVNWYHVDDVTITLLVSEPVEPTRKMAIEFDGGYEQINKAMDNPVCTYWYEVHPSFCPMYHLKDWEDNGDEYLSSCDWIFLVPETGEGSWWHVDNVTTDIIVSPLTAVSRNTYRVWYTIHNRGNVTAKAGHFTTLYVDNCTVEHKVVPMDLEPSQTYTDSFRTVVKYTPPEDKIIVCADDYNAIEELDEENNCLTNVYPEKPDLVITDKWVNWPDKCTICYNVTNIGNGTASAGHNTSLYVDGAEVAYDTVPVVLIPGGSHIGCFNYTWTYTPPSDKITICADCNKTIAESNEGNNCRTNIWTCGDVNCDEVVDMSDVIDLLYYVGYPGQYTICNEWAADVNCDKVIDMSDVIDLLYYIGYPGQYKLKCCCKISG